MRLTNRSIFILGTTKFDNPYESTTFTIAKYLAKENDVYYVENPFTLKDFYQKKATPEFERRKDYFPRSSDGIVQTDIPRLKIVITPPLLSINFLPEGPIYRLLLKINESIIARRLKKIIRQKNINEHIYINSFNFHYPNVAKALKPILTVYHCVDPLILDFDRKHGVISEQMLVENSDIVFCTSKQLFDEKKGSNKKTFFIPNAADISHCSKALDPAVAVHESLKDIPRPIVGYFGNIERRLDFDLIKYLSEHNPDKSFVFAGPVNPEFIPEWFFQLPNVYTTGRLDYEQLPAILKGFDVALIPFKKDDVSATIFPLKLFEYLGAGKPIVSTNFNPDLEEFTSGTVRFCPDSESFSKAVAEELSSDTAEKLQKRIEVANQNTWTKRVDEFSNIIFSNIKPN